MSDDSMEKMVLEGFSKALGNLYGRIYKVRNTRRLEIACDFAEGLISEDTFKMHWRSIDDDLEAAKKRLGKIQTY